MKHLVKLLLPALTLIWVTVGCGQSMEIYDPNSGNDWGTLNPLSKSDGVLTKKITIGSRDQETVRFRAPRLVTLTMKQPDNHWGNEAVLQMQVSMEGSTFSTERAITPTLSLTAGKAEGTEGAMVDYTLTVTNHGNDTIWGELMINGRPQLAACQGLGGQWPTDSIQYVASCTQLVDGNVAEQNASYRVNQGTACLARGVWGMNRQGYWTLTGHINAQSIDYDQNHSADYLATAFENGADGNRVEVTSDSIALEIMTKAEGMNNGDETRTVSMYNRQEKTLDFVQQTKGWGSFSEWETQFATRWKCTAL